MKGTKGMKNKINGLCLLLCAGLSLATVTAITGCAGNQYDRSTGQYIDDKSLTLRVHNALADNPDYKFNDVTVNVFRGTVQLNGFVNSGDQKTRAEQIARGVQGVHDVQNHLTIKQSP
jgi:hyperosmotically inducible periplasmic protein